MNLLNSKRGRMVAFGALYLSEGLPGGFLMMAIATELQRRGMQTAAYGAFVSLLALPWVWKFMMGPFVDNLRLKCFGARKQWIVMAQSIMLLALSAALFCMPDTIVIQESKDAPTEEQTTEVSLDEAVEETPSEEITELSATQEVTVDAAEQDAAKDSADEEAAKGSADEDSEKGFIATVKGLYLSGIALFACLLFLHNFFAATQDVAIDALACQELKEDERGLANGVMFSCTHAGYLIGGSGVLWLKGSVGSFEISGLFVLALMACILTGVIFFIREKSAAEEIAEGILPAPEAGHSGLRAAGEQVLDYLKTTWQSIFLSKNGFLAVVLALTPIGALALSMLLSALIAPRLGMTDNEIAALNTASTFVFIPFCLFGGWLSDRFNRKIILGLTASMTILPSIWIALQFKQAGWDHPPVAVDGVWPREDALIFSWWIATLAFAVFNGMMYGVKNALYMDIVTPKIAATQFTMLMAFTNLTNIYSKIWQSQALDTEKGWNWPIWKLLFVDAGIGLLFLVVLFFIKPTRKDKETGDVAA